MRPGNPGAGTAAALGVALVSAATLMMQVAITRIFSVTQWYHFAFMAVGLGLLGFGASGTALAVLPGLRRAPLLTAAWAAILVVPAVGIALGSVALVPFDAYLMALEPVQAAYLAAQVVALVIPFLFGGLTIGAVISGFPESAGRFYAASFLGAGAGALAAVPLLARMGAEAAAAASSAAAAAGSALLWWGVPRVGRGRAGAAAALAILAVLAAQRAPGFPMSPYKALSQLRRYPDTRVEFSRQNAVSRVDVVRSAAVRSAPGLSYAFDGSAPPLPALTVDGEGARGLPADVDTAFTEYLPASLAYRLSTGRALIVGMSAEVLGALRHGMREVTVLEGNPLVVEAAGALPPGVRAVVEHPRIHLRMTPVRFKVIQVPPQESFQVVASGAFSLNEHYLYTVEAFRDYLRRLAPGGVLAVTRWVQTPPSEEIRVWAAAVLALEAEAAGVRGTSSAGAPDPMTARGTGGIAPPVPDPSGPASRLMALRSLNTITVLVKPDGFTRADVEEARSFAAGRRFDITWAPGVGAGESNIHNVLPNDAHREAFGEILDPARRDAFLRAYPFDVRPVRDARPFFFHFFRWRQVPQVVANLGRTWQPFGGGGYLVLLAVLAAAAVLSAGLILVPLRLLGSGRAAGEPRPEAAALTPASTAESSRAATPGNGARTRRWPVFSYFLALGLAYLLVEIPLLQQMILVLGHPTYAMAAVLCGLLVASGAGSLTAPRLCSRLRPAMAALALAVIAIAWALPAFADGALGLSLVGRAAVLAAVVVPLGVLMGIPFPSGIRILGRTDPSLVPWAWGINGCASVLGSIAAAMLALEWGFPAVLALGGLAYAAALAVVGPAGWLRKSRAGDEVPPTAAPAAQTSPPPGCGTSIAPRPS